MVVLFFRLHSEKLAVADGPRGVDLTVEVEANTCRCLGRLRGKRELVEYLAYKPIVGCRDNGPLLRDVAAVNACIVQQTARMTEIRCDEYLRRRL